VSDEAATDPLTIGDLVRAEALADSMKDSMTATLGVRLTRIHSEQNPDAPPITALTPTFSIAFTQDLFRSVVGELARNTAQDVISIEAPGAASVFPAFDASELCPESELAAHEKHLDGGGKTSEAFARDLMYSLRRARLETERAWAKRRLYYSERQVEKRTAPLEAVFAVACECIATPADEIVPITLAARLVRTIEEARDSLGSTVGRCGRCHRHAPNPEGCSLCNPRRLGERLTEAHARIAELETKLGAVTLDRDALANYNRPMPKES
jgi:hypothetical protein